MKLYVDVILQSYSQSTSIASACTEKLTSLKLLFNLFSVIMKGKVECQSIKIRIVLRMYAFCLGGQWITVSSL